MYRSAHVLLHRTAYITLISLCLGILEVYKLLPQYILGFKVYMYVVLVGNPLELFRYLCNTWNDNITLFVVLFFVYYGGSPGSFFFFFAFDDPHIKEVIRVCRYP